MKQLILLTDDGLSSLIKQIHRRLPKEGGTITGDLDIKGTLKAQPASYPGMNLKQGETVTYTVTRRRIH